MVANQGKAFVVGAVDTVQFDFFNPCRLWQLVRLIRVQNELCSKESPLASLRREN